MAKKRFKPYIQDDRVVIPESIKRMTPEEREREITRLEAEARKERARIKRESEKRNALMV